MAKAQFLPPGPKEFKFVQAMKMGIGIYGYLSECHEKFGDAFTLRFPGLDPLVWVASPEMVKDFFNLRPEQIDQRELMIPIDVGDNQTGFLNGKEHQESRRIMIPPLVARRLQDRADVMLEITTRYIDQMKPGDKFDIPRLIGDITLDIACYTLLGLKDGHKHKQYRDLMLQWIQASTNDMMFLLGNIWGAPKFRSMLHRAYLEKTAKGDFGKGKKGLLPWSHSVELKAQLADLMRKEVREIRASGDTSRTDLIATLARSTYDDGTPLPEERVISESMGMLVGGHETSAATGSWFMLWLLKRPDVLKKMRAEVMECIAQEGKFQPLKIIELPYLNACLNESQRITPSAVGTMRHLVQDCQIGPLQLKAGTNVLAGAYLIHRRKDIWGQDADEYRPERWLEGFRPGPFEFFPFGGGRRACIGSNQAKQQLRIIFAEFARRVEFTSKYSGNDQWPGQRQVSGQTEPDGGVPVTVVRVMPANTGYAQLKKPKVADHA